MSPLLFVIVMEALSPMMSAVVTGSFISGFSVEARNDDPLSASHLLFANDNTLIVRRVAQNNFRYLRCVLLSFEVVLGLNINLAQTKLVRIGDVPDVNALARVLGWLQDFVFALEILKPPSRCSN
jgi:hypothetical protein